MKNKYFEAELEKGGLHYPIKRIEGDKIYISMDGQEVEVDKDEVELVSV